MRRVAGMAAVCAGMSALALQGAALAWISAVAIVLWLVPVLAPGLRSLRVPWSILTVGVVLVVGAGAIRGAPPATLLGALLAYLQIHRSWIRVGIADDRVSLLLAALMLVAGAGTGLGPAFLVVGGIWGIALPIALMPPDSRSAVGIGVPTVAMAVILFAVLPRPGVPALGSADGVELTGFSPDVELGVLDTLLEDDAVVFRAQISPEPSEQVYWRGIALDAFDGRRWRSTLAPVRASQQPPTAFPDDAVRIEVVLEPTPKGVLFTAGRPLFLETGGGLLADQQGGWFSDDGGSHTYRMVVLPPLGTGGGASASEGSGPTVERALALPVDLDPRVGALSAEIAGEGPPEDQIQRLATHLRGEYRYTREPGNTGVARPLSWFLFEERAGHCEYFATALAVMSRTVGIPTRVVNGFVGGDHNPTSGRWVVRRHHAHSWVEAHLPGQGWVRLDATPGPAAPVADATWWSSTRDTVNAWWVEDFLSYDQTVQKTLAGQAIARMSGSISWLSPTGSLPEGLGLAGQLAPLVDRAPGRALLLLVVVGILGAVGIRLFVTPLLPGVRGATPLGGVAWCHTRARRHVAHVGIRVPDPLPPVAAAEWVCRQRPGVEADALLALAWLHYEVALTRGEPEPRLARARALLAVVRRLDTAADVVTSARSLAAEPERT